MEKKILVVEDEKTMLFLQKVMLKGAYQVFTASASLEAINLVREKKPDLILMDVMLPDGDGIEAARKLKRDPTTNEIPILIVTSKSDPSYRERAAEVGCGGFITKPLKKEELIKEVERALS